ncbi:hypothetical protein C8R42DRAFT_235971 [Lentinula raphanica]|nr:hypothetical protein C8R42DRAFT_235971 [Lentinula raphanica]
MKDTRDTKFAKEKKERMKNWFWRCRRRGIGFGTRHDTILSNHQYYFSLLPLPQLVKSRETECELMISLNKINDPLTPNASPMPSLWSVPVSTCVPGSNAIVVNAPTTLFNPWENLPPHHKQAAGDKIIGFEAVEGVKGDVGLFVWRYDGEAKVQECLRVFDDRTRASRSDFVMIYERGREAVWCHQRCAGFLLVALREMRGEAQSQSLVCTAQEVILVGSLKLRRADCDALMAQLEFLKA